MVPSASIEPGTFTIIVRIVGTANSVERHSLPNAVFHLAENVGNARSTLFCRQKRYGGSEAESANRRAQPTHGFLAIADYFCGAIDHWISRIIGQDLFPQCDRLARDRLD